MKQSILKIKNTKSFAALICGLFIFAASAVSVSAEVCRKTSGGFPGMQIPIISFSTDTPQCKAAKEAFDSAIVIVTGSPNYKFAADNKLFPSSNMYVWVNDLAANPKYSAKFNDGLKFGDAVSFLKERIATNAEDRQFAIDNAFMEVYGRASNASEQAGWDAQVKAQKAWYAPIVLAEISRLNGNPKLRTAVIGDAYIQTMGKTPNGKEEAYWTPRTEHFRLIVQANRDFLYSPNGANDLVQTIRVAYLAKYKKDPSQTELKTALVKVTDKRMIFDEMMNPKTSLTN